MHIPPFDNTHSAQDCHGQRKALVTAQGYSTDALNVLDIARLFFASFSQPEAQNWMHAYDLGARMYGAPMGAAIAHATQNMLNQMRWTRPHTFNFTHPKCTTCSAYLTPEERYLMDSFSGIHIGDKPRARMAAMLLCEGKDPTLFLQAAQRLSSAIDAAFGRP